MVPVGNSSTSSSTPEQPTAAQDSTSTEEEKKEEPEEVKGDPEMAPVYLKNLLPLFAKNYKDTMMPSIRKATLALMRKMIHYASQAQLEELSQNSTFASVIVEVLSVVLDHEVRANTYILLTKREGRTGRISARGLDSTDRAQRGPYKKDRGPIFSKYGPERAWLIRDL